ncbi:hypothetical protein QBC35DRAFT_392370 [Podospora australis]|uniref:MADS-box domain-containing protein n=1 Tax=Podospora australis TaxID=1536484 RepID=A0AAN7AD25_9PEZI|nr:hypothetical protein QBC35DRAFT_392370 [Podospora australis]
MDASTSRHRLQLARIRKRRHTLFKKAHEFHRLCDAQVYLLIRKNCRFFVYTSSTNQHWPPTKREISTSYPLPVIYTPGTDGRLGESGTGHE